MTSPTRPESRSSARSVRQPSREASGADFQRAAGQSDDRPQASSSRAGDARSGSPPSAPADPPDYGSVLPSYDVVSRHTPPPSYDAHTGHLTDRQHAHLAALTERYRSAQDPGGERFDHITRDAYRNPHASPRSVRLALHEDMAARRRERNEQTSFGDRASRFVRAIPDSHANSVIGPAVEHAIASARGHGNADLVADAILADPDIRDRLMRREGRRDGVSHRDALARDLEARLRPAADRG